MYPYYNLNGFNTMGNPSYNQNFNPNLNQNYNQNFNNQNINNVENKQNVNWIYVGSFDETKDILVQANQTAWIMNSNKPEFYVKQADNMGICTVKSYGFVEINPEQPTQNQQNFVTKEEFEEFKNEMRNLRNESVIQSKSTTKSTTSKSDK